MKKVLLVTDGLFHPPLLARLSLHHTLTSAAEYSFTHCRSFEQLPKDFSRYTALVVYLHHKTISAHALKQLDEFVSGGGGLLAIHSATASFKQEPRYFEILGGRFSGHGPVKKLIVSPAAAKTLFESLPAFSIVDELYLHQCQPDITVQFTTQFQGKTIPMVWTRCYGAGRVCYAAPGHRVGTLQNATYQQLLQEALAWTTRT